VVWIDEVGWFWGLTRDFAEVFGGSAAIFLWLAIIFSGMAWTKRWRAGAQIKATLPVDARYQLFLSEGKGSCGFRYLKNHPAEAVERKPKPTRRITVIRTPTANVIMLPPWS
jgi:hypothetical protein